VEYAVLPEVSLGLSCIRFEEDTIAGWCRLTFADESRGSLAVANIRHLEVSRVICERER
jgi:hypothetical protein